MSQYQHMKMASTSTNSYFFQRIKKFSPVTNGRINIVEFLEASTDLVAIVERLGSVFLPVKVDMQGNIDKIKKYFKYDGNSCLLELMLEEKANGKGDASEAILWFSRAMLFFELVFADLLKLEGYTETDADMKKVFTAAYEGSVKKYHNWVTQQLFSLICKMSPNMPQLLKALDVTEDNLKEFLTILQSYNMTLHLVRSKLQDYFKDT